MLGSILKNKVIGVGREKKIRITNKRHPQFQNLLRYLIELVLLFQKQKLLKKGVKAENNITLATAGTIILLTLIALTSIFFIVS